MSFESKILTSEKYFLIIHLIQDREYFVVEIDMENPENATVILNASESDLRKCHTIASCIMYLLAIQMALYLIYCMNYYGMFNCGTQITQ